MLRMLRLLSILEFLKNWLVENVPDLSEIIQDEVAILLGEIVENSDEI
jgi:hypothetical protein